MGTRSLLYFSQIRGAFEIYHMKRGRKRRKWKKKRRRKEVRRGGEEKADDQWEPEPPWKLPRQTTLHLPRETPAHQGAALVKY